MLELAVIDDGPGMREGLLQSGSRGVGLRNTRERLAVLYGEGHRFAVLNSQPGLHVEMALPLETGARMTAKISTLIVDDEALARRGIELRLKRAADFEVVAQCTSAHDALPAIRSHKPDLLFLDIQMPGPLGIRAPRSGSERVHAVGRVRHRVRSIRHSRL